MVQVQVTQLVRVSVVQPIPAGAAWTPITFEGPTFDEGGGWNGAHPTRLTCQCLQFGDPPLPNNGIIYPYSVHWTGPGSAMSKSVEVACAIAINGNHDPAGFQWQSDAVTVSGEDDHQSGVGHIETLAYTDYVELLVRHGSSMPLNVHVAFMMFGPMSELIY